jgi:hypothetical protein
MRMPASGALARIARDGAGEGPLALRALDAPLALARETEVSNVVSGPWCARAGLTGPGL